MAYNEEQLNATITYILDFFRSRINETKTNVIGNNMSIFESNLQRIFLRELQLYNPENFELKKNSSSERYFIEWIEKNILPFPEDFSVLLTHHGDSVAMHGDIKTVIYSPSCTPDSSVDMLLGSDSMSICSPSTSSKKTSIDSVELVPISSVKEPDRDLKSTPINKREFIEPKFVEPEFDLEKIKIDNELQNRSYFNLRYEGYYDYLKATQKKEGKMHVLFDHANINENNIYRPLEKPKYDMTSSNETKPMYIPIYRKNKYGDVYRTMRATVADTISTPGTTVPATPPQKTDLSTFQIEYEELTNNLNNLRIN